jgi:hypothetical protein
MKVGKDDIDGSERNLPMQVTGLLLKQGLLLFWALWLSIAWLSNLCDALKAHHLLGEGWWFASGNYRMMAETTQKCRTPPWMTTWLFMGILAWEAVAMSWLWVAFLNFQGLHQPGASLLYPAFLVNLALWAALLIADELVLSYDTEATHFRVLMAQMITLLVLILLPEGT